MMTGGWSTTRYSRIYAVYALSIDHEKFFATLLQQIACKKILQHEDKVQRNEGFVFLCGRYQTNVEYLDKICYCITKIRSDSVPIESVPYDL